MYVNRALHVYNYYYLLPMKIYIRMGHDRTRPERPARRERSITRRRLVLDILRHDNGGEVLLRVREPSRTRRRSTAPIPQRGAVPSATRDHYYDAVYLYTQLKSIIMYTYLHTHTHTHTPATDQKTTSV